ncbi:MAG TPA: hypothetical protein DCE42_13230, partial [Myxococcales bacterium]|nr:hypothetical protein [Myxococcales bacterium]
LRVSLPGGRASLAATLGIWKSTANNKPILGETPGYKNKYFAASYRNAFRSGPFRPEWTGKGFYYYIDNGSTKSGQYTLAPLLVTMLNGRSYKDAEKLLQSALDAEKNGGAKGRFLLMDGRDKARGVLDREYDGVIQQLKQRGLTDVVRQPFNTDLTGLSLAAFITGTATLGKTIEGNTYLPGSLTDNLTSFGAVPKNFAASGQSQVSIARWVAKGVAGAHGTTDEPLNNVFPSRYLLVDYVDGSTLAEAYHRRMPYVYWRNLVLGDPMAAPYARKPTLTITGLKDNDSLTGAKHIQITAKDPEKRGIASLTLYVNNKQVAHSKTNTLQHCLLLPTQKNIKLLVVAQAAQATGSNRRKFQPKGWTQLTLEGKAGGPKTCTSEPITEAFTEPASETTNEPNTEPITEPTSETTTERITAPEAATETTPDASPQELLTETPSTEALSTEPPNESTTQHEQTTDAAPMTETSSDTAQPPTQGCGCSQTAPSLPAGMLMAFLLLFSLRRKTRP